MHHPLPVRCIATCIRQRLETSEQRLGLNSSRRRRSLNLLKGTRRGSVANMMMMSLNSKQAFAMPHTSLPEHKYSSLHSSSSSTLTSNAPSSSCSTSRHSSTISSSGSSEAMRRACLPTPPVRILHNHRLKAHFDSPLFLLDVFFMSAQQITQHLNFFPPNLCIQSGLPFVLIFMTWDVACVLFCVFFFRISFLHAGNVLKPRSGARIPC